MKSKPLVLGALLLGLMADRAQAFANDDLAGRRKRRVPSGR